MNQESLKVVVIGGAGAAGRMHLKNLKNLGAFVASMDISENPNA